jgi:phosphate transport system permease protein
MLDHSFTGLSIFSVLLLTAALLVILVPILARGVTAIVFRETVEHREMMLEKFERGERAALQEELSAAREARRPVYRMIGEFEAELEEGGWRMRSEYGDALRELQDHLTTLLGPPPGQKRPLLARKQYGVTRWDRARVALHEVLYVEKYDFSDPTRMGVQYFVPRVEDFKGTSLEPLFGYVDEHAEEMLRPRWTFYWRFLFDDSLDAHFFGGIGPEVLGTLYLTVGTMIFAVPMGVIAAVYLAEYAGRGKLIGFLRSCISTLAGVPSIVFGLFGYAFFINGVHVSPHKSVLAGSLTLALLVLPTVIRAAEEAVRAVPQTYREAALSMGASRWRTVVTVILPAALPGILTGIVISMGRAAGETAPIIFTAAVSVGPALKPWETLTQATRALPWNIYNLATEHEAVDQIRHVQYGMVATLILLVLLLNAAALILRARISKKLRG